MRTDRQSFFKGSVIALLALAFSAAPRAARADDTFIITVQKKAEDKQATRWSLSEWLETKKKFELWDMWLALHTPSPFEFQLGGYYLSGTNNGGGGAYNGFLGHFTAMAKLVGLEVSGESAGTDHTSWTGLFNLRIFGYNEQGLHITTKLGYRNLYEGASYRNLLFGGELGLPFNRFFGIEGSMLRYFDAQGSSGLTLNGWRYTAGLFIDFSFVRLLGEGFYEPAQYVGASGTNSLARSGFYAGTTLYF